MALSFQWLKQQKDKNTSALARRSIEQGNIERFSKAFDLHYNWTPNEWHQLLMECIEQIDGLMLHVPLYKICNHRKNLFKILVKLSECGIFLKPLPPIDVPVLQKAIKNWVVYHDAEKDDHDKKNYALRLKALANAQLPWVELKNPLLVKEVNRVLDGYTILPYSSSFSKDKSFFPALTSSPHKIEFNPWKK